MSSLNFNKQTLLTLIIKELEQELNQAISAANEAHAAAVDDQSVAETQYDTLAIEASYLAEGHSRRVQELQTAIADYNAMNLAGFDENKPIALSAMVQLSKDRDNQHWFFIGPAAGGYRCILSKKHITVITPSSPMGAILLGKYQDDDIDIELGNSHLADYITSVL